MTGVHVTHHAAERYVERVDGSATIKTAIAAIEAHAPAIELAAAFGAKIVKRGDGVRLILEGQTVVTVIGRHTGLPRDAKASAGYRERVAGPELLSQGENL
jgi:hypothetical protein